MILSERALISLVRDMLLVESRKARDWIASLPEEERQAYQHAYKAGVQIESDLRWIQKVREGEPVEDIIGDVLQFRKEKVQNALSGYNAPKDLSRYESVNELRKILGQIEDVDKQKENYGTAFQSEDHVTRVDKIGNWEILMPLTPIGSSACDISGKETTWCTTKRKGQNLFYSYVGRRNANIVLFYVMDYSRDPIDPFKRQSEACVEDNDARMCIGYFNGYPRLEGETGGVSVDASNKGLTEDSLKKALGANYDNIMETMEDFAGAIGGKHPAKKVMEKCSENPRLISFLVKNYGPFEAFDFFEGTLDYGVTGQVLDIMFSKCKKYHNKFINKSKTDYTGFIIKLFNFLKEIPQSNQSKDFAQTKNFYCNKIMEEHVFRVFDYYKEGYAESGTGVGYSNHMDPEVVDEIEELYDMIIKNADLSHDIQTKLIEYGNESGHYPIINQLLEGSDDIEFISEHVINNLLSSNASPLSSYKFIMSALENGYISSTDPEFYDPEHLNESQKEAGSRMVSAIFEKYISNSSVEKNTDVFRGIKPDTIERFRLGIVRAISTIQIASPDLLDKIFTILNDNAVTSIYKREYEFAYESLAGNHNLGAQTMQRMIDSDDPEIREMIVQLSSNLTREQMIKLSRDPFMKVRAAVASNPSTPPDVLESLVTMNAAITLLAGRLSDSYPYGVISAVVGNPNCTMRAMIRAHHIQMHNSVGSQEPALLEKFGVVLKNMSLSKVQNIINEKLREYNATDKYVGAVGARSFNEITDGAPEELIRELNKTFKIPPGIELSKWYKETHFKESFYWFYRHQTPQQVIKVSRDESMKITVVPEEEWSYDNVEVVPETNYKKFLEARGQEQNQFKVIRKEKDSG